jgi:carbon-monoxide dehydrogenase medium subunit
MFHRPATLDQALTIKARAGAGVTVIAGGTDLIVGLNRGTDLGVEVLDLSGVAGFDRIERDNGWLLLSGGTTFAQLAGLEIDCLARAARSVGSPQIRNRGTIAGNLATASPAGDGSVALLALDAGLELRHAERGARRLKLTDYFLSYRKTALADDELITHIRIPGSESLRGSGWYKIGKRGAVNVSVVCVAAARFADGRVCIALGSVAPVPMRAVEAERLIGRSPLTDELIGQAAERAAGEAQPIDDWRASADYRRAMCRTLTRRVLRMIQTDDERNE